MTVKEFIHKGKKQDQIDGKGAADYREIAQGPQVTLELSSMDHGGGGGVSCIGSFFMLLSSA